MRAPSFWPRASLTSAASGGGERLEESAGDGGVAQVDRPRTSRPRLGHDRGGRARALRGRPRRPGDVAVELDPGLGHLAVPARPPLPAADDGALVAEADWPRLARRRVATMRGDLRRHVGAEGGDLARLGLDEAEHVRRVEGAEAALENLGELERGGVTSW